MKICGYRECDRDLLSGRWIPGEIAAVRVQDWPDFADPHGFPPPAGGPVGDDLYVVRGTAAIRYADIDPVARRARLEIGVREGAEKQVGELLSAASAFAFNTLGMHRVFGHRTPASAVSPDTLATAGFALEGVVPDAVWWAGAVGAREIWAAVCDE